MTTNPADLKLKHIANVCQSRADNCQHDGHFVLFIQGSSFSFRQFEQHGSLSSKSGQQDRDMYHDDRLPSPTCPRSAPEVRVPPPLPPRGKDHRKCKDFSNWDLLTAQSLDI